jgi:hypothetical protein
MLSTVLGAVCLAALIRLVAGAAAEVFARYFYAGGSPVDVRFVEGRYGLVPARWAESRGLLDAAEESDRLRPAA